MPTWRPDPTFYPSPRSAMQAPAETLAYVVRVNPTGDGRPDAITVVDVDPTSESYGQLVGEVEMTHPGDELHHFGWNACSSMLCPNAPHPHVERRYLIVPGLGSSRIYIIDTKPDPTRPQIVKTIEPEEVAAKTGYANGHTVHCGPDGIYVSALGAPDGEGPGGIFMLDHDTFDVLGRWEIDRGEQYLHYDFWWHLGYDTMVSSEWGTPNMVAERGAAGAAARRPVRPPAALLGSAEAAPRADARPGQGAPDRPRAAAGARPDQGLRLRQHRRQPDRPLLLDLAVAPQGERQRRDGCLGGAEGHHHPRRAGGGGPAAAGPQAVQGGAAAGDRHRAERRRPVPLRLLLGHRRAEAVRRLRSRSTRRRPARCASAASSARRRTRRRAQPLNGGPQMVEVSRDGRRVYLTNSLYVPWDAQFYPDGIQGWMVKLDADPAGGMSLDPNFFLDFGDQRPHQVRLQGGDASTDSYCFP